MARLRELDPAVRTLDPLATKIAESSHRLLPEVALANLAEIETEVPEDGPDRRRYEEKRGEALNEIGLHGEAIAAYIAAYRADPGQIRNLHKVAWLTLSRGGDPALALELVEGALERSRSDDFELGARRWQDYGDWRQHTQKDRHWLYWTQASMLRELGRPEEAVEPLLESLLVWETPESHIVLSEIYEELGQPHPLQGKKFPNLSFRRAGQTEHIAGFKGALLIEFWNTY